MPIKKDTTDADIAAFEKWAGKATASEGKAAPTAPAEAAPSKPAIAPNVSGLPDPLGDWMRSGEVAKTLFGRQATGRHLTDEEMNWAQRAGRGIGKGFSGDVVGARSIAGRIPGVNEMLAKIPESAPLKRAYHSMKEFSAQPDTSWAETGGRIAGAASPFIAAAPLEEAAAATVAGAAPASAAGWIYPAMRSLAGAGVGGVAGAVQDPENPEAGALPGMIGGAAGPIASGLFRSPLGTYLGGLGMTEGAYNLAHRIFPNMPYHPWGAAIVWHASPVGRRLRQVGRRIVDEAGRLIGTIPSGLSGTVAGQALGGGTSDEQ